MDKSEKSRARKTSKARANQLEAQRVQNLHLNLSFDTLRQCIPYLTRKEKENLPKLKVLRLAVQYIDHMENVLNGKIIVQTDSGTERPLQESDFQAIVEAERGIHPNYKERINMDKKNQATKLETLTEEDEKEEEVEELSPAPEQVIENVEMETHEEAFFTGEEEDPLTHCDVMEPIQNENCNFSQPLHNQFDVASHVAHCDPIMMEAPFKHHQNIDFYIPMEGYDEEVTEFNYLDL